MYQNSIFLFISLNLLTNVIYIRKKFKTWFIGYFDKILCSGNFNLAKHHFVFDWLIVFVNSWSKNIPQLSANTKIHHLVYLVRPLIMARNCLNECFPLILLPWKFIIKQLQRYERNNCWFHFSSCGNVVTLHGEPQIDIYRHTLQDPLYLAHHQCLDSI